MFYSVASCFILNPFVTNLLISVSISVSSFDKSSINTMKLSHDNLDIYLAFSTHLKGFSTLPVKP